MIHIDNMSMLELIQAILTLISPIAVAWFGYKSTKDQKENKKIQDLQTEINKKNRNELDARFNDLSEAINSVKEANKSLNLNLSELSKSCDTGAIQEQLKTMIAMVNINFEYCQSLSKATLAMGDVMSDHTSLTDKERDKIEISVEEHRREEQEITHKIYNILR